MATVSRRNFLKGSAIAGGTMVGFSQLFGYSRVFAQGEGDTPQLILDLAATAEAFACTHYYTAINSADALNLSASEVDQLKAFLDSELKHKQFLEANGAVALATSFYTPEELFTDRDLFLATSNTAENWFVAAYLAACRRFAELGEPLLAATVAQVMGTEAEHQALLRLMAGLQPSFQTLKEPLFWNTSEVAPLFQPFLEGAAGFVGPTDFPGEAAIQDLVAGLEVVAVTPFIQLDGMGTLGMDNSTGPAMMMGAAMNDTTTTTTDTTTTDTTGACTVSGDNTNVRSGASLDADVTGSLTMGTPVAVIGQVNATDGFTWYQIDMGWVRADAVNVAGDCTAVPLITN